MNLITVKVEINKTNTRSNVIVKSAINYYTT